MMNIETEIYHSVYHSVYKSIFDPIVTLSCDSISGSVTNIVLGATRNVVLFPVRNFIESEMNDKKLD